MLRLTFVSKMYFSLDYQTQWNIILATVSFGFNFDCPGDGDDEVDGGPACDQGSDGHHQAGLLRVADGDVDLNVGHVDLVRKVEPVALGCAALVAVGGDASIREINY